MNFCHGCPGYCCYKEDGAVLLITAEDIFRLGRYFGISDAQVRSQYMQNRYSLLVREDRSCIFFVPGETIERCAVYEARPDQCRLFPPGKTCPYLSA